MFGEEKGPESGDEEERATSPGMFESGWSSIVDNMEGSLESVKGGAGKLWEVGGAGTEKLWEVVTFSDDEEQDEPGEARAASPLFGFTTYQVPSMHFPEEGGVERGMKFCTVIAPEGGVEGVEEEIAQGNELELMVISVMTPRDKAGCRIANCQPGVSALLHSEQIETLRRHMPPMVKLKSQWLRVFHLQSDGCSLETLLHRIKGCGPICLCIRDATGRIFGAFISCEMVVSEYFGDRSCFVFEATAEEKPDEEPTKQSTNVNVIVHPATDANENFMLVDKPALVVGGGNGMAIRLDGSLKHGVTQPCETFGTTQPLGSGVEDFQEEFVCIDMEAWAFSSANKKPKFMSDTRKTMSMTDEHYAKLDKDLYNADK